MSAEEYKGMALSDLFVRMRETRDLLLQMKESAAVSFDRIVKELANGKGGGTLEDIEDPVVQSIMCEINIHEIYLGQTLDLVEMLLEALVRVSCMNKED